MTKASDKRRVGSCLCGSVQVSVEFNHTDIGVCYCEKCRLWAGGPFFELECGDNVKFTGRDNIQTYASSEWAERGFCENCGTHLFIKDKRSGEYGIPPGLFDTDEALALNRQVFSDKKPEYYSFANETQDIPSSYIYQHYPETKE